jgi:hypothetical protein
MKSDTKELRKTMRDKFPDIPGDCIDHIIYESRQDLQVKVERLEAKWSKAEERASQWKSRAEGGRLRENELLEKVERLESLLFTWANEGKVIPDVENPRSRRYIKELEAALRGKS